MSNSSYNTRDVQSASMNPTESAAAQDDFYNVDIAKWTQPMSHTRLTDRIAHLQTPMARPSLTPNSILGRSQNWLDAELDTVDDSSDSGGEIAYSAEPLMRPDTTRRSVGNTENAMAAAIQSTPNVSSSDNVNLREIKLLEGSDGLTILPSHLRDQLQQNCQLHNTEHPECVKGLWPPDITIFKSKAGNASWFETSSGQSLLAARFKYGTYGQFVVVKSEHGDAVETSEEGKASIVQFAGGYIEKRKRDGRSLTYYPWKIWDPMAASNIPVLLWKVIETGKAEAGGRQRLDQSIKPLPSEADRSSQKAKSMSDRNRDSKRTSSFSDTEQLSKKPCTMSIKLDPRLLEADYPRLSSVGARRDPTTGEILIRRKSDGKVVALRCPYCDDNDATTESGLHIHLRHKHDIRYSFDELEDFCGLVVEGASPPPGVIAVVPRQHLPVTNELSYGQSSHRKSSRHATKREKKSPTNVALRTSESETPREAKIIFMKSQNDADPRIRPLTTINSAEKLFVNAIVAGIAQKDTLMLTITVGAKEPMHIVKHDKEDFEMMIEHILNSSDDAPDVVVTVEDLDT